MKKLKALDLFCGAGGTSKGLVDAGFDVTGIDIKDQPEYPFKFIKMDATKITLDFLKEFDFIWSSPPCPTHSKLCYSQPIKRYADMTFYQEIILLKNWFKGKWVIENVIPYYEYLIKPTVILGRHPFWSNFNIEQKEFINIDVSRSTAEELAEYLKMPIPREKARLLLRNCVEPTMGQYILQEALK